MKTRPYVVPLAPDDCKAATTGRQACLSGYTEAIGQDLGLIGADITIDLATLKPILNVALKAAHPNIGWTKQGIVGSYAQLVKMNN